MGKNAEKCRRCGACCDAIGSPPVTLEDVDAWPDDLRIIGLWFAAHDPSRYDDGRPCYFWNSHTKLCLIYEHRPLICRNFEPGGEHCQEFRTASAPQRSVASSKRRPLQTKKGTVNHDGDNP